MKLTLRTLVDSQGALAELSVSNQLPLRTAFLLGKVLRKANAEIEAYQATRKAALDAVGSIPAGKTEYVFPTPAIKAEVTKEINELLDTEIELPGEPFTLEKLGNAMLTPGSLALLDWLILEA